MNFYNILIFYILFLKTLLENGFLDLVEQNLRNGNKYLRKETAWILSNIASSGPHIIQKLMEHDVFHLMRQNSLHDEIIVLFFFLIYLTILLLQCHDVFIYYLIILLLQ